MERIFKEGDRVYCLIYGWGTICDLFDEVHPYPIDVKFDRRSRSSYTDDGRLFEYSIKTLSFTEYTLEGFSQERPEPLPKPGDVVWVRDTEYDSWMITYFRKFNANADTKLRYGTNPRNSADSLSIYYYKYLTTKNPYENN
jgi:hypothetical protein